MAIDQTLTYLFMCYCNEIWISVDRSSSIAHHDVVPWEGTKVPLCQKWSYIHSTHVCIYSDIYIYICITSVLNGVLFLALTVIDYNASTYVHIMYRESHLVWGAITGERKTVLVARMIDTTM